MPSLCQLLKLHALTKEWNDNWMSKKLFCNHTDLLERWSFSNTQEKMCWWFGFHSTSTAVNLSPFLQTASIVIPTCVMVRPLWGWYSSYMADITSISKDNTCECNMKFRAVNPNGIQATPEEKNDMVCLIGNLNWIFSKRMREKFEGFGY